MNFPSQPRFGWLKEIQLLHSDTKKLLPRKVPIFNSSSFFLHEVSHNMMLQSIKVIMYLNKFIDDNNRYDASTCNLDSKYQLVLPPVIYFKLFRTLMKLFWIRFISLSHWNHDVYAKLFLFIKCVISIFVIYKFFNRMTAFIDCINIILWEILY